MRGHRLFHLLRLTRGGVGDSQPRRDHVDPDPERPEFERERLENASRAAFRRVRDETPSRRARGRGDVDDTAGATFGHAGGYRVAGVNSPSSR
jgi:hypothetical protein